MIKEKHMKPITIISMILAIIFTTVIILTPKNVESTTIKKQTYMSQIFDKNKVIDIDIKITDEQWNLLLEKAGDSEYVISDIVINGETFSNVGIRAKGNSTLTTIKNNPDSDRFSFRIEFDKYIDGQNLYGLKTIVLNAENTDTTYMKEYISYDMWAEMGINTPGYAYANIKLNSEPWGLYLAVEVLEDTFLERNYGIDYGNLYKPESAEMDIGNIGGGGMKERPVGEMKEEPNVNKDASKNKEPSKNNDPNINKENILVDEKKSDGLNRVGFGGGPGGMGGKTGTSLVYTDDKISSYSGIFDNAITKSTSDSDKEKLIKSIKSLSTGTELEKYIDVDEVLRYFAVNTFLVNLDSYAGGIKHNFYLYEKNNKLQILPWDADLSFGSFQMSDASKVINFPIDIPVTDTAGNSPLIEKLLEVEEYKETYHKYIEELIEKYITSGKYESTINSLNSLIEEYVKNDATSLNGYDKYKLGLVELKTYGTDRTNSIVKQLSGEQPSTTYGNIETTLNTSALGSMGMGGGGMDRGGGSVPSMKNMPPMQNIEKIMEIVKQASEREFSEEEKLQLKELGVEESMYDTIKNDE